jgi:hyaluronoglucosaminidase
VNSNLKRKCLAAFCVASMLLSMPGLNVVANANGVSKRNRPTVQKNVAMANTASNSKLNPTPSQNNTSVPLRGVVEGFYGTPWSQADRLSMLKFMGNQQMNIYIYAPKDDLYHRSKWREPYPLAEKVNLDALINTAQTAGVEFVFAVSPGLDLNFTGEAGKEDLLLLLNKFSDMYKLGVRRFAIFFDDIPSKDGLEQARFINSVNYFFVHTHPDIKPLMVVPTEYNLEGSMYAGKQIQPYSLDFAKHLDKDVLVLFTGRGVVCEGVTAAEMLQAQKIYGSRVGLWWNYPVTDYQKGKLALGPVQGIEPAATKYMQALVYNPMEQADLSKIALATGADFALHPFAYDENASWEKALAEQYGPLAKDMEIFAEHSQRMGQNTTWAKTGRQDAQLMRKHMDDLWEVAGNPKKSLPARQALRQDLMVMKTAIEELKAKLPDKEKAACIKQLELLERLGQDDEVVLMLVEACESNKQPLAEFLQQRLQREYAALLELPEQISENTARAFINEGLGWYAVEKTKWQAAPQNTSHLNSK